VEARKGGRREREKEGNQYSSTLIGNVPYGYRLVGRVQFVGARAGFIINRDDIMRNNKKRPLCGFVCLFQIKW